MAPPGLKEPKSRGRLAVLLVGIHKASRMASSLLRSVWAEKGHSLEPFGSLPKAMSTRATRSAASSFAAWCLATLNLVLGSSILSSTKAWVIKDIPREYESLSERSCGLACPKESPPGQAEKPSLLRGG